MTTPFTADVAAVSRIASVPQILDLACRITGMGFAAVARVTENHWVCCASRDLIGFGLAPGGELKIETTICNEIRQSGQGVVIDHVAANAHYCGHPTPAMYGFQSYISLPIVRADGTMFGTLCAIDPSPRKVETPEVIATFKLLAELIATHLDALTRADTAEAGLADERTNAKTRDQFLAVLGHDLRSPLAALTSGIRMMRDRAEPDDDDILEAMQHAAQRMNGLIGDLTDLARTRLGREGLSIQSALVDIAPVLQGVAAKLRSANPERRIETDFALSTPVYCDIARIEQLFSNLLSNAVSHGVKDHPVRARASIDGTTLEIAVTNAGNVIPDARMQSLFEPVVRGAHPGHGLGMGLYLASQIAKAHGGNLAASSSHEETRFVFSMPTGVPARLPA